MTFRPSVIGIILAAMFCAFATGCSPYSGSTPEDEEKETYFIAGRKHQQNMDFEGAREMFEKAIEANPRSAAAHFRLAALYDEQFKNYVSAIYHYDKHLKLRPKSELAHIAEGRIKMCQLELAKAVTLGVASREVQLELTRLNNDNAALRKQIDALRTQLAAKPLVITNTVFVNQPGAGSARQAVVQEEPTPRTVERPAQQSSRPQQSASAQRPTQARPSPRAQATATARYHTVSSGETMASVARRYRVSVPALQNANPRVDARRMKVGTVLRIP